MDYARLGNTGLQVSRICLGRVPHPRGLRVRVLTFVKMVSNRGA